MKETYYFSHDYNSSQDPKVLNMLSDLKWEGYGLYWMLIEKLAEANGKLLLSDLKGIAFSTHTEVETLKKIIYNFSLFEKDEESFWSNRLLDHLGKRQKISKVRAKLGKKGGLAKAKQLLSNSSSKTKQSKVKESKGKETKDNTNTLSVYTDDTFNKFWENYPRKEAKKPAYELWKRKKLSDHLKEILVFVEKAKKTDRWVGGYIPHPKTFIGQERWNDDLSAYGPKQNKYSC